MNMHQHARTRTRTQAFSWDFDVFAFGRLTQGHPLVTMTIALLEVHDLLVGVCVRMRHAPAPPPHTVAQPRMHAPLARTPI